MDLKAHIGLRIKRARAVASLTQDELAERLGKSARMVSSLESGHSLTSLSTLEQIASILSEPLTYFFEDFNEIGRSAAPRRKEIEINAIISSFSNHELELAVLLLKAVSQTRLLSRRRRK